MRKINLILSILLLQAILLPLFSQTDEAKALAKFISNISWFNHQCPQEKVYLHFDNTAYYLGETIWFKAYVVAAESHSSTQFSKVLYTELLTPDGDIMETKKYPIENGMAHGDFFLKDSLYAGYYEVRAYTRSMLDFSEYTIFSRVFPVFDNPAVSGNYKDKKMTVRDRDIRVPYLREDPPKRDDIRIDFFPEGGNLISGISNRVAFKATDKEGRSIEISGIVYDNLDNEVTRFSTQHLGMGIFDFVPQSNIKKKYYAQIIHNGKEIKKDLPKAYPSGYALQVNNLLPGSLLIQVEKTNDLLPQALGLSIACRGKVYAFDILTINESGKAIIQIPKAKLPAGVQQITLFTPEGEVVAERLAFVNHEGQYATINASIRQDSLFPLQAIEIDLEVKDTENNPVAATFSLAIRDKGSLVETYYTDNIRTNLLLSSELRGYIENPAYYFEANDNKHRLALDLLMLVQGWRRYDWEQMAGIKSFGTDGIEHCLLLEGRVLSLPKKMVQKGMDVKMWAINKDTGEAIKGNCVTDEGGYFNFDMGAIHGRWDLNLQTTRDGKRKATKILLNRHDSPPAKHPEFQETTFPELQEGGRKEKGEALIRETKMAKAEILNRQKKETEEQLIALPDSLKTYQLNEVVVDGKKKQSVLAEYARLNANLRYDVDMEMEKFINKHDEYFEHDLWFLLSTINPHFGTSKGYKDRGYKVYYDNMEVSFDPGLDIEDIQSVVVVEHDVYDYELAAVYIYTKNNGKRIPRPNGIRRSYFMGYNQAQEYYNPDYTYGTLTDVTDHRRTLYWSPNVETDDQGRVSIKFFNNSVCTQLNISAEGISGILPAIYVDTK